METHRVLTEKRTVEKRDDLALMMRKFAESQCHCQGGKLGGLAGQSESGVKAFV